MCGTTIDRYLVPSKYIDKFFNQYITRAQLNISLKQDQLDMGLSLKLMFT
jgi:hypothetical protein